MPEESAPARKRGRKLLWLIVVIVALVLAFDYFYPDVSRSGRSPVAPSQGAAKPLAATEADFDERIASGVRLVDFWATWCGPCQTQAPIVAKLAERYAGKAEMLKVDIDENPALAERYQVSAIPTLLLFKDGKVAGTFVGVHDEEALAEALDNAL